MATEHDWLSCRHGAASSPPVREAIAGDASWRVAHALGIARPVTDAETDAIAAEVRDALDG